MQSAVRYGILSAASIVPRFVKGMRLCDNGSYDIRIVERRSEQRTYNYRLRIRKHVRILLRVEIIAVSIVGYRFAVPVLSHKYRCYRSGMICGPDYAACVHAVLYQFGFDEIARLVFSEEAKQSAPHAELCSSDRSVDPFSSGIDGSAFSSESGHGNRLRVKALYD